MPLFPRIPALPRAIGTTPGPVKPGTWNALVDAVEALDKRIAALKPISSSDLTAKSSQNGFSFSLKRRSGSKVGKILPFQVSASPVLLQAAPGVIGSTTVSDDADLKVSNPANGNHYLLSKVVINATTGAITSEEVYWATSVPANTTTDFYGSLAFVEITAGEITQAEQYNYGPIYVIVGGGATDIWTVVTY